MSAVLARTWQGRTKGRDWYDLIWYVAKKIPLHLKHLENRLKQARFIEKDLILSPEAFSKLYVERVEKLDVSAAKADVVPFIRNPQILELWSQSYFTSLLSKMTFS